MTDLRPEVADLGPGKAKLGPGKADLKFGGLFEDWEGYFKA